MKKPSEMGKNLTGIALSPIDGKRLADFAAQGPVPAGSDHNLQEAREAFSRESGTVGTVPPPASITGLASAALDAVQGKRASAFIDHLAERISFERTGTRLYDALLAKYDGEGGFDGGPSRARLVQIHQDELRHVGLLEDAILSLGGDPTVVSPMADVAGVASSGLIQVVTDPRTSLDQGLHAILIAELADHEGWSLLADMADGMGRAEMAAMFRDALADESQHLADVRNWLAAFFGETIHLSRSASRSAPAPGAP